MLPMRTQALVFTLLAGCTGVDSPKQGVGLAYEPAICGCAAPCGCVPVACVPVPVAVKVVKPVYRCQGNYVCLPKRSLLELFFGYGKKLGCCTDRAGECACGSPLHPGPKCECSAHRKMVLFKKLVTTERSSFKCAPVCGPSVGCGNHTQRCGRDSREMR